MHLLALSILLFGCGGAPCPSPTAPEPEPDAEAVSAQTLALGEYPAGLRTLEVEVGGAPRRMLFDTGAGVTAISPDVARAIGCEPYGRLTGHRQTDERIDMPLCPRASLTLDGRTVSLAPVGVFDVGALLPGDWPSVDGVVGLNAFEGRTIALDLACGELVLDAQMPPEAATARARLTRDADGVALGVLVSVATTRPDVEAWFQVDSGNTGPVLVAEHMAELLEVTAEGPRPLAVSGFGRAETPLATMDLIHDGNLGARFLTGHRVYFDLQAGAVAVMESSCGGAENEGAR